MGGGLSVAVAVPVYGPQDFDFWGKLFLCGVAWSRAGFNISLVTPISAMPDVSKNIALRALGWQNVPNETLTSHNRNVEVDEALRNNNEWVLWLDHDTEPEQDVLPRLLALGKPFVAGVYYHRNDPHRPLMYRRLPDGLYRQIDDFERGALMQVDACGMGLTLIHREVYDTIRAAYRIMQRADGSLTLVHQDDIAGGSLPARFRTDHPIVCGDELGMWSISPVRPAPSALIEQIPFPYYVMEHGRTEDLWFCELAKRVGYEIWVDTSVEARHWHKVPIDSRPFEIARQRAKIEGQMSPMISPGGLSYGKET